MKKSIISIIIGVLVILAFVLFVRVVKNETLSYLFSSEPIEALASRESPYPYACYQSLGYCYGSGAGLSWKCIMTTSGDRCVKWYCRDCD